MADPKSNPMQFFKGARPFLTSDGREPETREDHIDARMVRLREQYGPFSERGDAVLAKHVVKSYDAEQARLGKARNTQAELEALRKDGKTGEDPEVIRVAANLKKLTRMLGSEMLREGERENRLAQQLQKTHGRGR